MVNLLKLLLSLFFKSKKDSSVVINKPLTFIPKEESLTKKEEVKVSGKIKHVNNGDCPKCEEIINRYKNPNAELVAWFKELQIRIKDCHLSYFGRGREEQELFLKQGTSKAAWLQSPHNYNAACDIFRLTQLGAEFNQDWYKSIILPEVKKSGFLTSGGEFKSIKDWPHVEITNWKELIKSGNITPVE